jgi:hypothetical protein
MIYLTVMNLSSYKLMAYLLLVLELAYIQCDKLVLDDG